MRAGKLLRIAGTLAGGWLAYRILFPSVIRPEYKLPVPELVPGKDRFPHDHLDAVLSRFVDNDGLVDYAALNKDRARLDQYLSLLAAYSPHKQPELFPSRSDKLAYWINAYNAFTLAGVLREYPLTSILQIRPAFSFCRTTRFIPGGQGRTLNEIERDIIRQEFKDPRAYFALTCASMGCPKLLRHAFHPDRLDDELRRATALFVAEDRNVHVDLEEATVTLSSIFRWYERDFLAWMRANGIHGPTLPDYIKLFADEKKLAALEHENLKVDVVPFDWRLNDKKLSRREPILAAASAR